MHVYIAQIIITYITLDCIKISPLEEYIRFIYELKENMKLFPKHAQFVLFKYNNKNFLNSVYFYVYQSQHFGHCVIFRRRKCAEGLVRKANGFVVIFSSILNDMNDVLKSIFLYNLELFCSYNTCSSYLCPFLNVLRSM